MCYPNRGMEDENPPPTETGSIKSGIQMCTDISRSQASLVHSLLALAGECIKGLLHFFHIFEFLCDLQKQLNTFFH